MNCIFRSSILVLPALAAVATLATLEGQAHAVTFVLGSTGDAPDFVPGNGVCETFAGVCTLRAAVMEANALFTNDVIEIPAGLGPISLTFIGAGENAAGTGDLDIWGGPLSGGLTISGNGAVINGVNNDRIFHLFPSANVTITDVTLRNGWGGLVGGAIYNEGILALTRCEIFDSEAVDHGGAIKSVKTLVMEECEIHDNVADRGGGIYSAGDLTIRDSTIQHNEAGIDGGGMYVVSAVDMSTEVLDTFVSENDAVERGGGIFTLSAMNLETTVVELNTAGAAGGGLYMEAEEAIVDAFQSDFIGNESHDGGGIYNSSGELTLRRVGVWDNAAVGGGSGGGIHNRGLLIAQRGAVYANTASVGGGIHSYGGDADLTLHNMTISGNTASGAGGGLRIDASAAATSMNNVTIVGNSGWKGGISTAGPTVMVNTIVGDNVSPLGPSDCDGSITSNGYNLIEAAGGCVIGGPATADFYGPGPFVGALASNGGRTPTHALLAASPARNSGDNATCLPVDQRGVARPQGGTCDRGAYERN